jgi:hypothetical protein
VQAEAEVSTTGIAYDFGAARPQRILKSTPGNRGTVDREATMRHNLHTVGSGDERDLQGTWAQDARGLGSPTGAGARKSRPSSAHHSRRSDTNRQNSHTRITTSAGRFAHSVSGADMAAAGIEQHLSNLDIGAGTPGDSMVSQNHPQHSRVDTLPRDFAFFVLTFFSPILSSFYSPIRCLLSFVFFLL